ncbi:uncharacterized protein JCM6883_002600 [Sporobolomyces salmoneus]|uniref:uncharacterized protein n=1 Tax=Sporobolomyces salmoneus TaxID=183962 RepID=UPI003171D35A
MSTGRPDLPQVDRAAYDRSVHVAGEGYSDKNKIPTVSAFLAQQQAKTVDHSAKGDELKARREREEAEHQRLRDEELKKTGAGETRAEEQKSDGAKEKEEMMEKARASTQPNAKEFERKGEREVYDPVTGQNVIVKDAKLEDFQNPKLMNRENLDPANKDAPGPSTNVNANDNAPISRVTPAPIEPSNILFHPMPPPVDLSSLSSIKQTINAYALGIIAFLGVIWFFVAFRSGATAFVFRSSLIGGAAVAIFLAHGIVIRKIEKELERIRLKMHEQRGEQFAPPTPESVEWLNSFTKVVWPLVNPDMFTSVVDMIEDVMQASLPGFIDAVKVEDFTIGKNAFRILNIRALPDQPTDPDYPKEEWIDQGDREAALDPNRREKKEEEAKEKKLEKSKDILQEEGTSPEDEDQTGDYVNMEISFAYFAPPGKKKLQGENISLIIKFFLGVHDLFHLPIPLWIAVESIVGTVRLRCQLVAAAPFIRNVTFTLMGVPAIEASAIPLTRALPNVLDLPLISGFVQSSIAAATSVYCAPKSMTMNIAQMISGDGVKRDTKALGVFMITIHYAEGLSAQDDNGTSDPYVVVAYSKFGKPLFSTRVVQKDLNPVWEQTTFLLVTDDEVRADEKLSIQLWDSDMMSADDLVGRTNISVTDLMLEPNKVHKRVDKLMGFEDADAMAGTLTWSVAYFEKAKLNPALKLAQGIDHSLPKELQDHPELKVETNTVDTPEEADVSRTPPDPNYPSGILSVTVHNILNLERQNLKGASGKSREGESGQDTDDAAEQADNLPSAYCEFVVNDDLVFKTRTKQYTSAPFYQAEHEEFIRDYRKTSLRVVVRDARLREHDPILGIVNLPLKEILAHSSEVTRLFRLEGGVGFGKISISILFKGVKMSLPKELSGWDTGTICVTAPVKVEPVGNADFDWQEKKLVLSTSEAKEKISSRHAETLSDGALQWNVEDDIRLPTYDRYSSALYFDYGGSKVKIGPLGNKTDAFAMLWLADLVDDEPKEVRLPIICGSEHLKALYISDQTKKTHDYEIVGWLTTTVMLDSGLDSDHEKYATTQTARHEFEQYDIIEGQAEAAENNAHANDDGVVDKEEQKRIDRAHKKALEQRHRGKMQFAPVRSAVWAKDGMKDRLRKIGQKMTGKSEREDEFATEV